MILSSAYLFAKQISPSEGPTPPRISVLFENGKFNPLWVGKNFSLDNYEDVINDTYPPGHKYYFEYCKRLIYWNWDDELTYPAGLNYYIRDVGSSLYSLTADGTLVVDNLNCAFTEEQNDIYIRLLDDHPSGYTHIYFEYRYLDSNLGNARHEIDAGVATISIDSWEHKELRFTGGGAETTWPTSFPSEWRTVGGQIGENFHYADIWTWGKYKMEVRKIYFTMGEDE